MNEKYRYLPISRIQSGMVLASQLLDKQGQVLLPAGAVITEQMISSLLHHDIHQLPIFIGDKENEAHCDLATHQEKIHRLNIILRHAPFEEPRNSLANYIQKYRLEQA